MELAQRLSRSFALPALRLCERWKSKSILTRLRDYAMVGELALSGEIRRVRGVLPITLEMRRQNKRGILVPEDNAEFCAPPSKGGVPSGGGCTL